MSNGISGEVKICQTFSIREVIKEIPVEKIVSDTIYIHTQVTIYLKEEIKSEDFKFEGINFETDKANFLPESFPILIDALNILKKYPKIRIEIQGHTDSQGASSYNQALSQRRSDAVKKYLVNNGIDNNRLVAKGYGETKPISTNNTAEGRLKNRRIDIIILEK